MAGRRKPTTTTVEAVESPPPAKYAQVCGGCHHVRGDHEGGIWGCQVVHTIDGVKYQCVCGNFVTGTEMVPQ